MESKEKILKGVEELFFKYGIKNITMDEIARHMGISKKTIYHYFKDKDEVVHSLMLHTIEDDRCRIKNAREHAKNVVEEVFKMMDEMREMLGRINPILFYELHKFYPQTWKIFQEFKSSFILAMVEASLRRGQQEGYIRLDIDIKILTRMRVEMVEQAMKGEMFPSEQFNVLDVQLALTEHFLYGVCTLKGHKLINKYKNIEEE
ncbi:MAG: TetR/AcrR family transcriptional regulator [Bacteroidota bacterium]|nr:TetR/AcrR family transcriptional regulator [Bacteroidota bacterium]